jgi:hypothetical protein
VLIFQSDWGRFFPWTMPGLLALSTLQKVDLSMPAPLFLVIGAGGGLLFAALASWDIGRRDVL